MKKAHAPWTVRKLKIMLDKAILLQEINKVQYERRKETIKLFYEVPKEHRKRNWYTTLREYNIMKTLSVNSQQMEPTNETPVVETPVAPAEEVVATPEVVEESSTQSPAENA